MHASTWTTYHEPTSHAMRLICEKKENKRIRIHPDDQVFVHIHEDASMYEYEDEYEYEYEYV